MNPPIECCYLINTSNNHNKFYEMQVFYYSNPDQYEIIARWGKIGSKGRTKMIYAGYFKDFTLNYFNETKKQKLSKGYIEKIDIDIKPPPKIEPKYMKYLDILE